MKLVVVTGGFDPVHSGHISYFKEARSLGDLLIVGLNSDEWLTRKKGRPFMPYDERFSILSSISYIDDVISFDDNDNTAIDAIVKVKQQYQHVPNLEIIFANGGDRTKDNIPEMIFDDVKFIFGIGGSNKKNSSSWILEEWSLPKTTRSWGFYQVLKAYQGCKVKELVINPGEKLSMQRHFKRAEHWYVLKGTCTVEIKTDTGSTVSTINENQSYIINQGAWHRAYNITTEPCHILEVQHGEICVEEDIERM